MLRPLARQLGIVLLATSLVTAPVLGGVPRCSKTGALAGGGNCCCADREAPVEPAEVEPAEASSCCAEPPRSCCQSDLPESKTEFDSVRSRCSCQASAPPPAIPGKQQRCESREELLTIAVVLQHEPIAALHAASLARQISQAEPIPIPLRKIYCRWTV